MRANAGVGVYSRPEAYASQGNRGGAQRFRCKACRKTFSVVLKSIVRQKAPHLNRTVFAEVVSKKPLRGIMEVTGLSASAVYDKLDFLYRQCRGFAGERERRAHRIERKRVRLCVDQQDYMINWRSKSARKNIQLTAICAVEADSGYVIGHHLNFDPDINQTEVEDAGANWMDACRRNAGAGEQLLHAPAEENQLSGTPHPHTLERQPPLERLSCLRPEAGSTDARDIPCLYELHSHQGRQEHADGEVRSREGAGEIRGHHLLDA